eukprot:3393328-Ditylum_brightwellii.AAC.1
MTDQFLRHNIIQRVKQLYNKIKRGRFELQDVVEQYETLNKQITEIMLSAERRCRKPKTGKAGSIELVMAARVVRYWKTRRSDLINNCQPSWQLLQLGTGLNIPFVSLSVNKIMKNITAARKKLRQIQHNAAEIRD